MFSLLFFISSRVSGLLATCWYLDLVLMQNNRKGRHLFCVMMFENDSGSVRSRNCRSQDVYTVHDGFA